MGRIYLVADRGEINRRRQKLRGVLIEAWPDLHGCELFWLGDDETRRVAYASDRRQESPGGLFWIGEESKAALDTAGGPLAWDLAIDEGVVPIFYGPHLSDAESLPREESVRARVLSANAIAAVWTTYDPFGNRVEHQPSSPLDPTFHLRRPGGKSVHLFRVLSTKAEASTIMTSRTRHDPEALAWVERIPATDFVDLLQRHAVPGR